MRRTDKGRAYGWKPDLPDHRDFLFAPPPIAAGKLPEKVSLKGRCGPILDQGALGSCTAHAARSAFAFLHSGFEASRLQIYYEERRLEGTTDYDSGAAIRDAIKVLAKIGAAPEAQWPYKVERFDEPPPASATKAAAAHRIAKYQRLAPGQYRQCLAAGYPFQIGFTVYAGFEGAEAAETGRVRMPGAKERALGGHAVCVIGYARRWEGLHYEVQNSWGSAWGASGRFWIPAQYLENLSLADDAWRITA